MELISESSMFNKIFSSQSDRGNYTSSKGYLNYFIVCSGIKNEDAYNIALYNLQKEIQRRENIALFTSSILNTDDFDIISYLKMKLKSYKSSMFDVDIDLVSYEEINNRIKRAIDIFLQGENSLNDEQIRMNFIIKVMSWMKMYINPLVIDYADAPKVIFYGAIKKHEVYFLMILYLAGFDILYINPTGVNDFKNTEGINKYKIEYIENDIDTKIVSYQDRIIKGEVLDKTSIKKAYTIGAQASKKISEELLNEAGFIKPWQLQDRKINSLLLSSTIDEVDIYWNEPQKLRPGFKFDSVEVTIPVFFTKINGTNQKEKEYTGFIDKLLIDNYSYYVDYEDNIRPLSKIFTREGYNLSKYLNPGFKLNKNAIIMDGGFSISALSRKLQMEILEKVEETILSDMFIQPLNKDDIVRSIYTVLNMNEKLINLINGFDYANINPKLILYVDEMIVFTKEIVFLLLVLSKMGFDIVIFAPGGVNCIENIINNQIIDIHRLDIMNYNLKYKPSKQNANNKNQGSWFSRLFGKRSD